METEISGLRREIDMIKRERGNSRLEYVYIRTLFYAIINYQISCSSNHGPSFA